MIDYVADLGDCVDSTYAVTHQLLRSVRDLSADPHAFRRTITVHSLDGCRPLDSLKRGAVQPEGEQLSQALRADGSVVPAAIKSRPVMTISALAEGIAAVAAS